jgi:hypothetical protein
MAAERMRQFRKVRGPTVPRVVSPAVFNLMLSSKDLVISPELSSVQDEAKSCFSVRRFLTLTGSAHITYQVYS